jgi:flagellar basal-body rod modification protein FlgD
MDAIQAASNGIGPAVQAKTATAISSDFQTFLRMLTAQMNNQDPLNPIESTDFAVQLATFSGVEQQVRSNDLLEALGVKMGSMGLAQMAGWVGMEARAAAPALFDGSPIEISPNPAAAADTAVLVVRDEDGNVVQRLDIPVSAEPFEWAGVADDGSPLPNGVYSFEIESYDDGELMVTSPTEVYVPIIEARGVNGQTVLVLEGGAQIIAEAISALRAASD